MGVCLVMVAGLAVGAVIVVRQLTAPSSPPTVTDERTPSASRPVALDALGTYYTSAGFQCTVELTSPAISGCYRRATGSFSVRWQSAGSQVIGLDGYVIGSEPAAAIVLMAGGLVQTRTWSAADLSAFTTAARSLTADGAKTVQLSWGTVALTRTATLLRMSGTATGSTPQKVTSPPFPGRLDEARAAATDGGLRCTDDRGADYVDTTCTRGAVQVKLSSFEGEFTSLMLVGGSAEDALFGRVVAAASGSRSPELPVLFGQVLQSQGAVYRGTGGWLIRGYVESGVRTTQIFGAYWL